MKRNLFRLIAALVVLCLLLTGCDLLRRGGTPFDNMVYTRPNLPEFNACADRCTELASSETELDKLWPELEQFFLLYSDFYTQYLLAYVHYCRDMRDIYWTQEYNYCEARTSQVESARDQLLHELAKSPLREKLEGEDYFGADYFDGYEGESIWTEEFQALKKQESELVASYYQICQDGSGLEPYSEEYYDSFGTQLEELYVELVALRQKLAQTAGYESYPAYAYEQIYGRDYTVTDAAGFCEQICQDLVPLYRELADNGFWEKGIYAASEQDTYQYVRTMAKNMGAQVQQCFDLMVQNELYDLSRSEHKFDNSFEVYFYNYGQPYVFVSPTGSELDHLAFAHEFGHFCNDHISFGSSTSTDAAEIFSQGMEYLSLFYADPSEALARQKLADSLCVYVEQAAYNCFEEQVYGLSAEELTAEKIRSLYETTCKDFGLDWWVPNSRSYVGVPHFFVQPLYVISYVVSNDAAFQLYQLEQRDHGAGLDIYLETLDTQQEDFLPLLKEAGLDSPFVEDRIKTVKETLREALA